MAEPFGQAAQARVAGRELVLDERHAGERGGAQIRIVVRSDAGEGRVLTAGRHGVGGQVVEGASGRVTVARVAEHPVGERQHPGRIRVARQTVFVGEVLVVQRLVQVGERSVLAQLPDHVVRGARERGPQARALDRGHGHATAVHGQGPGVVRAVDERLHAKAKELASSFAYLGRRAAELGRHFLLGGLHVEARAQLRDESDRLGRGEQLVGDEVVR